MDMGIMTSRCMEHGVLDWPILAFSISTSLTVVIVLWSVDGELMDGSRIPNWLGFELFLKSYRLVI